MENTGNTFSIDRDDLVARLNEVDEQADGDLARMIELLLLENHVLRGQQSAGLLRGLPIRYETYPRFLTFSGDKSEPGAAAAENKDDQT